MDVSALARRHERHRQGYVRRRRRRRRSGMLWGDMSQRMSWGMSWGLGMRG